MLLATGPAETANTSYLLIYIVIGLATIVLGLWKRVEIAGWLKRFGGVGGAKAVVELFEKEVSELRTQRAEMQAEIDDLKQSNTELKSQIRFLVAQMTGETPIRELSGKIDLMTTKIGEGIAAILERVGAA